MEYTDLSTPDHFQKVVDCQHACPAHTPVPQYIRLIAQGRYAEAYMVNWEANVFPGILGRTCDRPCEPACRRSRVEKEPVAICRLKRAAADNKGDISKLLPKSEVGRNGKRVALVGGGPASLTVARDLSPMGYECVIFDEDPKAGGMMRTRIPRFRVPEDVIDEEVDYVLNLGVKFRGGRRVDSLKTLLAEEWDAVFIGTGAPRGHDLALPGRFEANAHISIGLEWLANIWFQHVHHIGKKVIVIGGGNTAMDCARSARRLGAEDVKVIARSTFADMKATAWEKDNALREGILICNELVPKYFAHKDNRLTGVMFEQVTAEYNKGIRTLVPTGAPLQLFACDDVLIAAGQEPAFTWIERDIGIEFNSKTLPKIDPKTFCSTHPKVFFGGDAAFGPKNIITAVAQGHDAAISIDRALNGKDIEDRPLPHVTLIAHIMPAAVLHIPKVSIDPRFAVPLRPNADTLADIHMEIELGFDIEKAIAEAGRCLNCDLETVFTPPLCVECKACETVCPTDCITFTKDGLEDDLRNRLKAPAKNLAQDLYVAGGLVSGRVMVKNEDVCIHCGLCAQNCPTGAWQMETFLLEMPRAGGSVETACSGAATND